jgi:hypothetical protein
MAASGFPFRLIVTSLLLVGFHPPEALSSPFDGRPKLLLHVSEPAAKNPCSTGLPSTGADAVVAGGLVAGEGPAYVYLLAAGGSDVDSVGMAGAQFGITYGGSIAVHSWTTCAALEFPMAEWPASGSGNLVVWMALSTDLRLGCQLTDTSVLGYLYVGAYAPEFLALTPRPVDGWAKTANCSSAETVLGPSDLGYVAFSSGAQVPGCNPYNGPCGSPPTPDTTPPAAIIDLAVTAASDSSIALAWTAPGDDADSGTAEAYDLRYSPTPIDDGSFAGAAPATAPDPMPAGAGQAWTVEGLESGTTYYFAIKARDEVMNWSSISNVAEGMTSVPPDTIPPGAVGDLAVVAREDTALTLAWSAPGDDDFDGTASEYDLRYSTAPLTPSNFDSATQVVGVPSPGTAGTPQSTEVGGLTPGTTYYFSLRTADEVPQWSILSNVVSEVTTVTPSATFSELPAAFVMTPSGSHDNEVRVSSQLGPMSGVTVTLTIEAGVDTFVRWAAGQDHPVLTAMTDAGGVARFGIAGGMPPMIFEAVIVHADGHFLGQRPLVATDVVNDLGQTIDNPCLVRCGELEVNALDLEFHARNLGSSDWRSDFDGDGLVDVADTLFAASLLGDLGTPVQQWFTCAPPGISQDIFSGVPYDSTFAGVLGGDAYVFLDSTPPDESFGFGVVNASDEARDLLYRFTDIPPDFDLAPHEREGCLSIPPRTLEYIPPPPIWQLPQMTTLDSLRIGMDVWVLQEDGIWTLERTRVTILVNGWDIDRCPRVTILSPNGEDWIRIGEAVDVVCAVDGALVLYPVVLSRLSVSRLGPDGEPTAWEVVDEDLDARESPVNSMTTEVDSLDGVRMTWTPPAGLTPGGYALVVEITDSRGCVSRDTVRVVVPAEAQELEFDAPESASPSEEVATSASTTRESAPTRVVGVSRKLVTRQKVVHNVAELDQHEVAESEIDLPLRNWGCGPTSLTSVILAMALCDSGLVRDENGNPRDVNDIAREFYELCNVSADFGCAYSNLIGAFREFAKRYNANPACKYGIHNRSEDKSGSSNTLDWELLHSMSILPGHFTILRVGNHFVVVDSIGTNLNAIPRQVRIMDPGTGRKVVATHSGPTANTLTWPLDGGGTHTGPLRSVIALRQECRKSPGMNSVQVLSATTSTDPFPGVPDYPPRDRLFPVGWDLVVADSLPGAQPHLVTIPVPPEAEAGDALLIHVALVDSAWAWHDTVVVVPIVADPSGVDPIGPPGRESILHQNFPNPFRGTTVFPVLLREHGRVSLDVHSVDGRLVRRLLDGPLDVGAHLIQWDGLDQQGHPCPAGLYFVRLSVADSQAVRRVALLR